LHPACHIRARCVLIGSPHGLDERAQRVRQRALSLGGGVKVDQCGTEKIATQEVEVKQEGSTLHLSTLTRGLSVEEGGYLWSGEMRLWDNEILMGWYASNDGSIRSKGTMYFVLHPHGLNMSGRWVGLGYDDQVMTGFASMAHSREEAEEAMARLIHSDGEVTRAAE